MIDNRRPSGWCGPALLGCLVSAHPLLAAPTPQDAGESPPPAEQSESPPSDFVDLELEQLMQVPVVEVTSVAGVATPLHDTPAAIFVVTNEDIRRGGHRSIADSLRMVPGLNVAGINANTWAISSRGFNDRFANKMLVLIDGRAVYNDLFAGVFWDEQDVVLEDVDRIEVIRGPGATLWGANAVNGVINVTTKSARDTQGLYLEGGGGNEQQGWGVARYGGRIADDAHFRVYSKYANHDTFDLRDPRSRGDAPDDWDRFQTGFRVDLGDPAEGVLTMQGDAYDGRSGEPVTVPTLDPPFSRFGRDDTDIQGANILARLEKTIDPDQAWSVQAYFDYAERSNIVLDDIRRTADVEFRHHFGIGETHDVIWGAAYRNRWDQTAGSFAVDFDPADRSTDKFSAFVQDTIHIIPERLALMLGSKFEENDYTGFEVQPSARFTWTPDPNHTVWGAFSRAVRTPSRTEDDVRFTLGVVPPPAVPMPTPIILRGDRSVDSEELLAYELGYRVRPTDHLTFDFTGFYNDYENIVTVAPTANPLVFEFANGGAVESYGFEAAGTWQPADNWRIQGGYTFLKVQSNAAADSFEGTAPEQQFTVRSYLDITDDLEFNAAAYYVDNVPAHDVPGYIRLDAGFTWRPAPNVEFAVWGQNLLDGEHQEFLDASFSQVPIEIERSFHARVSLRF